MFVHKLFSNHQILLVFKNKISSLTQLIQSSNLKLDYCHSSLSFKQNQLIEAVSLLAELRFRLADFDQFWAQFDTFKC